MKYIQLTKGYKAIVDDEDFKFLNQWKWQYQHSGCGYAGRGQREKGEMKTILMHRLIMQAPKNKFVDHINRNGLDNRKSNLRLCKPYGGNNWNRSKSKNCSSKYRGISWNETKKGWMVAIMKNRRSYNIGFFKEEHHAAMAYDIAAKDLHGEFANLNFKTFQTKIV